MVCARGENEREVRSAQDEEGGMGGKRAKITVKGSACCVRLGSSGSALEKKQILKWLWDDDYENKWIDTMIAVRGWEMDNTRDEKVRPSCWPFPSAALPYAGSLP